MSDEWNPIWWAMQTRFRGEIKDEELEGKLMPKCEICGGNLHTGKRFCSPLCSGKSRASRRRANCKRCGKEFVAKQKAVYCSLSCSSARKRGSIKCTKCHAMLGVFPVKSAKMLGVSLETVRFWRSRRGVSVWENPHRVTGKLGFLERFSRLWESEWRGLGVVENYWVKHPEINRHQSRMRHRKRKEAGLPDPYHAMSPEQRVEHNLKVQLRRKKNPEKYRKQRQAWLKKKRKDPMFRKKESVRARLSTATRAIINNGKTITVERLCGCSSEQFKEHIESLFQPGMCWENYGKGGWEIDHKVPCAAFDLSRDDEVARCFHFTNLQPMWARQNRKKHAKLIHKQPQLPLLHNV